MAAKKKSAKKKSTGSPKATCQVTGTTAEGKKKRICHKDGKIVSFDKAKQIGYTSKRSKAS